MTDPVLPLSTRKQMWDEFWQRVVARAATKVQTQTATADNEELLEVAD